jgi:GNAT superfamily N-acetyltransferase
MTVPSSSQATGTVADMNEPELVRLRDGSLATLRATTAADEPALRSFLAGLGLEAQRLRFFSGAVDLSGAAHLAADTSAGHFGLVAHDEMGALVAHALYIRFDGERAEVAVEIADHLHGRGLGTILLERLGAVAERHGVTRFVAEVLPDNRAMLDVFSDGFDAHIAFRDGMDRVEFPTSAWRTASERFPEPGRQRSLTSSARTAR